MKSAGGAVNGLCQQFSLCFTFSSALHLHYTRGEFFYMFVCCCFFVVAYLANPKPTLHIISFSFTFTYTHAIFLFFYTFYVVFSRVKILNHMQNSHTIHTYIVSSFHRNAHLNSDGVIANNNMKHP